MIPLARPLCIPVAPGQYHCADIRTLYLWLEHHGYHFSGRFGSEEYGRFVSQKRVLGAVEPLEHSSSISIYLNGTVIAEDEDAQQLLVVPRADGSGWPD
jgi:hypothetical protein